MIRTLADGIVVVNVTERVRAAHFTGHARIGAQSVYALSVFAAVVVRVAFRILRLQSHCWNCWETIDYSSMR